MERATCVKQKCRRNKVSGDIMGQNTSMGHAFMGKYGIRLHHEHTQTRLCLLLYVPFDCTSSHSQHFLGLGGKGVNQNESESESELFFLDSA